MHAIFHAIHRTISIQSPDHDTQALERAPVFCGARVFFDAVGAALRVAIEAGQTKGLILRHRLGTHQIGINLHVEVGTTMKKGCRVNRGPMIHRLLRRLYVWYHSQNESIMHDMHDNP